MHSEYYQYREKFPDDLNIQHKITPRTEKDIFHLHSNLELVYAISDNLICYQEHDARHLPAGSVLLLNSMSLHYIDSMPGSGLCDRYVLYFNPDLVLPMNTPEINLLDCFMYHSERCLVLLPTPDLIVPINDALHRLESSYQEGLTIDAAASPISAQMNQLQQRLRLGELLIYVNQLYHQTCSTPHTISYQQHSNQVYEVCKYIDTHFAEPISLDDITREFLISKTQLYNNFREVLQMSVSEYLAHVRITQAKTLLISTDYSMDIISQKTGYLNASSFSRLFKQKAGIGPLQYRKKHRS